MDFVLIQIFSWLSKRHLQWLYPPAVLEPLDYKTQTSETDQNALTIQPPYFIPSKTVQVYGTL